MSAEQGAEADAAVAVMVARTSRWVDEVVIGLGLCPFAKAVQVKGQVRYVVSQARDVEALVADLTRELLSLQAADPLKVDTTVLIHPWVLTDFLDYNDFVSDADDVVEELGLAEEFQLASFHPEYRYAGSPADDPANYTNRSPYPMLHLLREASVTRAVDTFPDTATIFERNIEILRALPEAELQKLRVTAGPGPEPDSDPTD